MVTDVESSERLPSIGVPPVAATLLALALCGMGCTRPANPAVATPAPPAAVGSRGPDLVSGADGRLYLSWVEPEATGGHALRFAAWLDGAWTTPRTVAAGDDWFINWADSPSLAAGSDGTLAAQWLVRSPHGKFASDVLLSVSTDGGGHWTAPVRAHDDGTPTEHGFVSLVPREDGDFSVVWLDGRETVRGGSGATSLRHARLSADGSVSEEALLDDRVCDCCHTAALARADGGILVAYRDRSGGEIRDIYVLSGDGEGWSEPERLHADDWRVAGCPVNGPALAARGDLVALTWFTAGSGTGVVKIAFSEDGGRSFGEPRIVDDGNPLGRVDISLDEDGVARVVWLGSVDGAAELRARAMRPGGPDEPALTVAGAGRTAGQGFPTTARHDGRTFVAWTAGGETPGIVVAVLR